ncbi:MAG: lipoate--protein ligase family protein [Cyclobacteriaceae bacterium]|nr:lipoate--protein ligase family protein [Cyclobacteriaceae bacterium]
MKNWRYIDQTEMSASKGLATDEYLTNLHTSEGGTDFPAILRLYNYKDHSVLVGRFQDINAEIDIEECESLGFGFGRRLTGGGAILMGANQLGICFTTNQEELPWEHISELYKKLSAPILDALKELGIEAAFRSKNDLEVEGKKIAGLGVYISPSGAIQFHASLLLDFDIDVMLKVLKIPIQKFSDKRKIASIEQRITSINRTLGTAVEMTDLKSLVLKKYAEAFGKTFEEQDISTNEQKMINHIARETYENEEWIFQRSPQADMTGVSLKKTPAGLLRTYIGLKGENIKSVLITGDFLDQEEMLSEIESRLKWSPLDKDHITKVVDKVVLEYSSNKSYSHVIENDDIVNAIWVASQRALAEKRYTYNGSCYYPKVEA